MCLFLSLCLKRDGDTARAIESEMEKEGHGGKREIETRRESGGNRKREIETRRGDR